MLRFILLRLLVLILFLLLPLLTPLLMPLLTPLLMLIRRRRLFPSPSTFVYALLSPTSSDKDFDNDFTIDASTVSSTMFIILILSICGFIKI